MSLNIGIGFVTGRKHFQQILSTYVNNWLEHGLIMDKNIRLHLLVAYDLKYRKTRPEDFKNIKPQVAEMIDSINFYGKPVIENEKTQLIEEGILSEKEADILLGDGYAKKRNAIVYFAIKNKMDRLIFLDDDEYPVSVMKNNYGNLIWMGQSVVGAHIKFSANADITHGHHCGYISPIPHIAFNSTLTEEDFQLFISALSNEIISWNSVRESIVENNGVTFADSEIINNEIISEVGEKGGMKFISGANLCINLKRCANKLPPFYNPPGARGEDTFMSTALSDLKVLKIPVYAFHDGFLLHKQILRGSLPITLQPVEATSPATIKRFVAATIGWIRYKPLMIYITRPNDYAEVINKMRSDLEYVIPKFCSYFGTDNFRQILPELAFYHKNVRKHFETFALTKLLWKKLIQHTLDTQDKENYSLSEK